mmetsp:Transcript_7522/g.13582  ORF Transcript_7522/g.13582 Transcript_7522/m.13582 type:complete len:218 (-) Transcript_7522:518-1171(-)
MTPLTLCSTPSSSALLFSLCSPSTRTPCSLSWETSEFSLLFSSISPWFSFAKLSKLFSFSSEVACHSSRSILYFLVSASSAPLRNFTSPSFSNLTFSDDSSFALRMLSFFPYSALTPSTHFDAFFSASLMSLALTLAISRCSLCSESSLVFFWASSLSFFTLSASSLAAMHSFSLWSLFSSASLRASSTLRSLFASSIFRFSVKLIMSSLSLLHKPA